jgi:hypothetical protein
LNYKKCLNKYGRFEESPAASYTEEPPGLYFCSKYKQTALRHIRPPPLHYNFPIGQ